MKEKKIILGTVVLVVVALGAWFFVMNTPIAVAPTPRETTDEENVEVCIQVITPARNPETGEIKEFPTPCDVPDGWELIENDIPTTEIFLEAQ